MNPEPASQVHRLIEYFNLEVDMHRYSLHKSNNSQFDILRIHVCAIHAWNSFDSDLVLQHQQLTYRSYGYKYS